MNIYRLTRKNPGTYYCMRWVTPFVFPQISLLLVTLLITLLLIAPQVCNSAERAWVLVDTEASIIKIMRGNKVITEYDNIALGRRAAAAVHFLGDETTPLGEYKIISIHPESRYKLFFGLDYPTIEHADLAFAQEKISVDEYWRIAYAHRTNRVPPSNTVLGGAIGIHGIGGGNLAVHNEYNWTEGCVALNNDQIIDFAKRVGIGTRVVIQ